VQIFQVPICISHHFKAHLYSLWIETCASDVVFTQASLRNAKFLNADLSDAGFADSDLGGASFTGVDLSFANFYCVNSKDDFCRHGEGRAKNLSTEQLLQAKSLYKARLLPEIENQLRKTAPHLFEEKNNIPREKSVCRKRERRRVLPN
jgi:Pentapeptide repeats (8 copies)